MGTILKFLNIAIFIAFLTAGSGWADDDASRYNDRIIRTMSKLLKIADKGADFAEAKVIIDKLVAPAISGKGTLADIDKIRIAVEQLAGADASPNQKIAALRTYLYNAGTWNDHQAFSYDMDDPLGTYLPSKLLANYLDTRKGNCISMPFLFIAIADRMGLQVTASTAPHHVFVKYTNEVGETINLETTSGANPTRDAWIRQNMPMTDTAIENGVYLKTLSRQETIVVMAMLLIEHAMEEGRYGTVLNLVDLLLPNYPSYVPLHLARGSAAYKIMEVQFQAKYPTPRDIPAQYQSYYWHLAELNQTSFDTAEQLGWIPEK